MNMTDRNSVSVQSRSRQVAVIVLLMPDAVDTLTWAPDDGWRYHLKHVEWFTDINKLYIVASCWTFIGIHSYIITSLKANTVVFKHLHNGTHNYVCTSTAGLATVLWYFKWVRLNSGSRLCVEISLLKICTFVEMHTTVMRYLYC